MSETYESPSPEGMDGPVSRPDEHDLPPKTGGDLHHPGESVDPGMPGEGGDVADRGGMLGEGGDVSDDRDGMLGEG